MSGGGMSGGEGGLGGLYQELILDHARTPEGVGLQDGALARSHQVNPTCGDEITLELHADEAGRLRVRWEGHGCAISQASASLLTTVVDGTDAARARELTAAFREAMRSRGTVELAEADFGDAVALNGVSRYVARVKCAMLSWVALEKTLDEAAAG